MNFEYGEEVKLFFKESVINLDTPSAVLSATFPENAEGTL